MSKSERRQRTKLVALRLTPIELDVLRDEAKKRHLSLSKLVREAALAAAVPEQQENR